MEIILIFFPLFLLLSQSPAISANIAIKDGDTIVSDDEMFELGFFSPKNSKNRYLGIWYKKISNRTIVWVANRETPITDTSGIFKLGINGRLLILNGNNTQIWSSNSTVSTVKNLNPVARLLGTGNLVIWDENLTYKNIIWQSFDYPGDTLLPGMKLGKDLVTGIDRCLTSWKSDDDPSPGLYVNSIDVNGFPQVFQKQGSVIHYRIGPWNGVRFHGMPMDIPNQLYSTEFIINKKEIYFKYELKSQVAQRVRIRPDGNEMHWKWIDRTQEWIIYANSAMDTCGRYGMCGPYGVCGINKYPLCSCTVGFVPVFQEQWNAADWSSGCTIKQPLSCGNEDGFKKVTGLKFPDTRNSSYNVSMTLGECEIACKMDCNCTAYANLDIRNGGSGCLMWFGELLDMREYDEDQSIYIKVAASELLGESKASGVLTAVLVLSSVALLISVIVYAYRNRKKKRHMKRNRKGILEKTKTNSSVQMEDLDELPFFSLNEIVNATNNFSIDNKIGEGGFGPVYKGVFEDGREVAVKRLSDASQQGLDEFKNEVLFIAKLQHRNLVKLIGYCIHENEMILIYEYMANNSLDSFIYDETRSLMLDWPKRVHIIHGMARGVLYLHQDSRLQIIHRDLKAGNILLDDDMNPKISDFGLARKFVGFDTAAKTKKVVGTYGYISPEYAVHGRFSTKSDVFSFGVIVLEIVSGKKNREFSHEDHNDNLLGHAWRLFRNYKSIELMSASLRDSCIVSQVQRLIHIGLLCVQHHAEDRPTMLSVVLMLVGEGSLPQPKQPGFVAEESIREVENFSSVSEYPITLTYPR